MLYFCLCNLVGIFSPASGFIKFLYISYTVFIFSGQCRYSILVTCHSRGSVRSGESDAVGYGQVRLIVIPFREMQVAGVIQ